MTNDPEEQSASFLAEPLQVRSMVPLPPELSKYDPQRMIDDLITRALAYRTGPELKALVNFMRRFPHVAPYNAMLLHVQNPGIAYALRAPEWERKYLRLVKPAARPYVILWTMGPVAFVFDLSDTQPINASDDRVPLCVSNPFPAKGQPPPAALPSLIAACLKIGILIEVRDFGTELAGRVQRWRQGALWFHIALNAKHSAGQQVGTLAHELAHVFCGHMGKTEFGFWPDRSHTTRQVREVEAEAAAYFVCERMSLDIGSTTYLASYLNSDEPLPDYSLDAVLKEAGKIEQMLAGHFRAKKASAGTKEPAAESLPQADLWN